MTTRMMDGLTTLSAKERNPNQNKDTTRIRWPLPPSASVGGGCPASSSAILQHLRHRAAPPHTAPLERKKKKETGREALCAAKKYHSRPCKHTYPKLTRPPYRGRAVS